MNNKSTAGFINLSNGSRLRADTIMAVRPLDEGGGHPPRVVVDYVIAGNYSYIVLPCETNKERDVMAGDIMLDIEFALSATSAP